jgi:hypothetical protein
MSNKTQINHNFFSVLRAFLVLCAFGMFLSQGALAQEEELVGKAKGKARKSEEATPHRIVIAPVTISIPDESALINVLRPFSTPSGSTQYCF